MLIDDVLAIAGQTMNRADLQKGERAYWHAVAKCRPPVAAVFDFPRANEGLDEFDNQTCMSTLQGWDEGLLHLPAPRAFFILRDYIPHGASNKAPSGIDAIYLVEEADDAIGVMCAAWRKHQKALSPPRIAVSIRKGGKTRFHFLDPSAQDLPNEDLDCIARNTVMDTAFCLTMLNVEQIEKTHIIPTAKKNIRRAQHGKPPLCDYHVVRLPIERFSKHPAGITVDGRASPRWHLRRGHIRKLPGGPKVWVKHCMVGNPAVAPLRKHYEVVR